MTLASRVAIRRCTCSLVALLVSLLATASLFGQADTAGNSRTAEEGAPAISAADVRRHIDVMNHDSLRSRATPSRGLELTTRYVAGQFEQLGLQPAGYIWEATQRLVNVDSSGRKLPWTQRYPLPGTRMLDDNVNTMSRLQFITSLRSNGRSIIKENGIAITKTIAVSLKTWARIMVDTLPESNDNPSEYEPRAEVRVLTGRHTAATVQQANIQDKVVLYVPPATLDSASQQLVVNELRRTTNVAVVSDEDSATFVRRHNTARIRPVVLWDKFMDNRGTGVVHWAVQVWSGAVANVLAHAGLDLDKVRTDSTPSIRTLQKTDISLYVGSFPPRDTSNMAPNVVGLLPGTDPVLRNEYIIFSAPMDRADIAPADSLQGNVNDNAPGIAGLLALAKAFSPSDARPRRSLLFVATSGSANGLWGANAFQEQLVYHGIATPLNVTLDRLDRAPDDALLVNGLTDADFVMRPDWIAAQHPELRLTLVDGGTVVSGASDHAVFVAAGIPSLLFYGGRLAGDAPTTRPETVGADHIARRLRLIYYIGQDVANALRWPRWTAHGRKLRQVWLTR